MSKACFGIQTKRNIDKRYKKFYNQGVKITGYSAVW